nr:hypothetical protein [Burkholderiales bacterium]
LGELKRLANDFDGSAFAFEQADKEVSAWESTARIVRDRSGNCAAVAGRIGCSWVIAGRFCHAHRRQRVTRRSVHADRARPVPSP